MSTEKKPNGGVSHLKDRTGNHSSQMAILRPTNHQQSIMLGLYLRKTFTLGLYLRKTFVLGLYLRKAFMLGLYLRKAFTLGLYLRRAFVDPLCCIGYKQINQKSTQMRFLCHYRATNIF